MQADSIIEKAKKLGINPGNGVSQTDKLRAIANQLGVEDLTELEETLDRMLQGDQTDQVENLDDTPYNENEYVDNQGQGRFGEAEYNQAKNKDGVYDKNYYANRGKELDEKVESAKQEKNKDWKMKDKNDKGPVKADGSNTTHKSKWDKAKDNANLIKAKNDRFQNKISSAKAKAYNIMHPGEALKDKAKSVAKNATKKTAKAVAQATKKAIVSFGKWLIGFIATHPYVAIIVGVVLFILFLIITFYGTGDNDVANLGYYDSECNYNETTVNLKTCNSTLNSAITLEEYVLGTTYSYIKDADYSDEAKKALMIILKTNALSLGNYSNSRKSVSIDDCNMDYTPTASISSSALKKLQSIYDEIEEEIFVSESYTSAISNLSSRSALTINSDILNEIESLSNSYSYSQILNKIYNKDITDVTIEDNYRDTIFVGDSRMLYMKNYGLVSDSNSVYAGAMGYYWFNGNGGSNFDSSTYNCQINGINCVSEKIGNNPTNIVIWLGVNDTTNYERYYNKYYELANGEWANHYVYIVSVGYVDDNRSNYAQNSQIDIFNDYMSRTISGSGLKNLSYIDLGYDSTTMANGTTDGVHYGKDFSQKVYDNIISQIGSSTSISENKKIYKLSSYCTYYNVTENDAYWWPIGSSNTTSGKIYGGSPTTTYVSSGFGPRTINGKYSNHKGIDIAANCQSNVIIATKSGTVTHSSDTCDNSGGYGNDCGGGYGNYVIIDHDDGTSSVYAHMYPNSLTVKEGDRVEQGEKVGLMGNSGSSTGCHLHFEIRLNGVQVNPLEYINADNPRPISQYNLASVNDSGTSAAETKISICKSLLNSGFSKNAVAGMLVNIQAEGAFKTNNLEGCYEENQCCYDGTYGFCQHPEIKGFGSDAAYTAGVDSGAYSRDKFVNDHAGYGLIQWTSSGRKAGLYDYAKSQNKSIAALSVQLGYLLEEIKSYPTTYKYVTGNYSAYDIANNFCLDFESPKNENTVCPARASSNTNSMVTFVENGCS